MRDALDVSAALATEKWRPMTTAPRDGSRILVVIRGSEQGPSDVDVVRWAMGARTGELCWTSSDSTHDCAIIYDEWEVAYWMPLPSSLPPVRTPDLAAQLPAFPHEGQETEGSGI